MNKLPHYIVFLLVLACFAMPIHEAYVRPLASQWELFTNTWLFIIYGFVVYIVGVTTIKQLFE